MIDRDGNIVSLIQSLYSSFGSGVVAPGTGVMLHNRGALFTIEDGHPNQIAPRKRPLHTIIPAFMEKGDVKIGFGIMGGFNQAQAHAQFVSDVADFGLDVQEALEVGRFNKDSFQGATSTSRCWCPDATRDRSRRAGPSGADRAAAIGHVRVRAGRHEQRRRRPLRRLRAETRRRRDPRGAAGVQEGRVGGRTRPKHFRHPQVC